MAEAVDIAVGDDVVLVAALTGGAATVTRILDIGALPAMPDGHHGWDDGDSLDATPEATAESSST